MRLPALAAVIGLGCANICCGGDDDDPDSGSTGGGSGAAGTGGSGADAGAGGAGATGGATSPLDFSCESSGQTVTAAQDGTGDHDTVQACVDALSPGDTCLVSPGVYSERVDLSGLEGTESA